MRSKIAIAISSALITAPVAFAADQQVSISKLEAGKHSIQLKSSSSSDHNLGAKAVFTPEANLGNGTHRYFVRLTDSPVALYEGGVGQFEATTNKLANGKLDMKSKAVINYRSLLNKQTRRIVE